MKRNQASSKSLPRASQLATKGLYLEAYNGSYANVFSHFLFSSMKDFMKLVSFSTPSIGMPL